MEQETRTETPVAAREAATVVVCRPGPGGNGIEVLVLRRSPISRFAPGFVVFPGGVVEPGDGDLAGAWFGDETETARACALRELAEETGLVMTGRGLRAAPGKRPGEADLTPPSPGDVPEIARWVAPEFLPVRFDARFFALPASRGLDPVADAVEAEEAWWAGPAEVLRSMHDGAASLMWPTLRMLEAAAACRSVDEVLGLRVDQVPPPGARP